MYLDRDRLKQTISEALQEDIGQGDITSQRVVSKNLKAKGIIKVKKSGIICGLEVVREVFEQVDPELQIIIESSEGEKVEAGEEVMFVKGSARSILAAERVALNFLNTLSGTATLTKSIVDQVKDLPVQVLDTRKTLPNLRYLQKYAVSVGGGKNHRMGLYDMVLIKDNHISAAGSISAALEAVEEVNVPVEVECKTMDQVREAISFKPEWIMLDNMSLDEMDEAVKLIAGVCKVEASGGINLNNIRTIAKTGVDAISLGALTHSSHNNALDISLDLTILRNEE